MIHQGLKNLILPEPFGDLRLRYWEPQDAPCVYAAASDTYIPLVTSIPAACDRAQALDWIRRQNQKIVNGSDLPLCIAAADSNEAVGMMGLFGFEGGKRARCGYWVSPAWRGKNISARALRALSEWAFAALPLEALELWIEPSNLASIRVAEMAGYSLQDTFRAHTEIGGVLRDMALFVRVRFG